MRSLRLRWDEWNEEHVVRHGVDPAEVEEVARNAPHVTRARDGLYRVIGQTDGGRFLTVYVAPRKEGRHYVVTARDADDIERRTNMSKPERPPNRIPVFDSIEEAAEFWDTHDSTEFEDEWEPVEWTIGEVTSVWLAEIEFDRATWVRLREAARRRGLGINELAREWVMEGLERTSAEDTDASAATPPAAGQ